MANVAKHFPIHKFQTYKWLERTNKFRVLDMSLRPPGLAVLTTVQGKLWRTELMS